MNSALVEIGLASLPAAGQSQSGDSQTVISIPHGVLIAVVDGLGHGEEAAAVARLASATLEPYAHEPVISLIRRCHDRLRGTRGAVMSVASISALEGMMTWAGVGNVEGKLLRADPHVDPHVEFLLLRGGVMGSQLPPLFAAVLPIEPGDTLIFFTDGVRSGFIEKVSPRDPPQEIADRVLAGQSRGTDDALVLAARYLGGVS